MIDSTSIRSFIRMLHDADGSHTAPPYYPAPYRPTLAIIRTHLLPRLGLPKNIGVLWEGTADQIETYIIGICVGSIFIVGVMTVALIIMAVLNAQGYGRVGVFCGHFEYNVADATADSEARENDRGTDGIGTASENGVPLRAVRTIGVGGFAARGSHVSVVIGGNDENTNQGAHSVEEKRVNSVNGEGCESPQAVREIERSTVFTLKFARINPDGQVVVLPRPKPVPKELWLKVEVVRALFILCGIGAIVSAGLFYGLGVKKFQQSLLNTRSAISRFNALASKAIVVTDNLLDIQYEVEERLNTTDKALYIVAQSCNLDALFNTTELIGYYELVKGEFNAFSVDIKGLLKGFSYNVENVIEAATTVSEKTHMANIAFAVMVLVMCIMIILIVIMIIGVGFAAYEIENCSTRFIRRVVLLPVFILQVVLATIFSAVFFIAALAGSDFCVQPDQHAGGMLGSIAAGADDSLSPLFSLVLFYLSGCQKVDLRSAQPIQDVVDGADTVLLLAHDIFDIFNALTPQDVLMYCDVNAGLIGHFDELGGTLHNATHQLHVALDATLDILSCGSVHPVYSNLIHDAACIGAVGGMEGVFSTLLSIAVLSCCMVALRAAMHPIQQTNNQQ